MVSEQPLILLAGSFMAAVVLVFALLKLTPRLKLLAHPNDRSSHVDPTPTAGGVAIVLIVGLYLATQTESTFVLSLAVGSFLLASIGLWDDVSELGRGLRLLLQMGIVCAVLLLADVGWPPVLVGIAGFVILWHVNLFNFMDGIDGIAGVQVLLFAFGALLLGSDTPDWITTTLWVVTGSTLGFLVFNWPPARIFMGDVGSLFFGFLLAFLVLELTRANALPLSTSLILLGGFWFDATYTLAVRLLTRQNPFQSHRIHLYQKLSQRFGHRPVTTGFALYGMIWLFPLAAVAAYHGNFEWLALSLALLPLLALAVVMKAGVERQLEQHR